MSESDTAVLVLTGDHALADDVRRLAAAAGVAVGVVEEVQGALTSWAAARAVVVGADLADRVADSGPVRRGEVHVITRAPPPDALFRAALGCGAADVLVLPRDESQVIDALAGASGSVSSGLVIAVLGGAGGAGASVFATALSMVLARRGPTLLVDGDPEGAGIEVLLGLENVDGARWDVLGRAVGRLTSSALRDTLPGRGDLRALLWPPVRAGEPPVAAVREVLRAARRAFSVVVVDLPRHPGGLREEVLLGADQVLLVSRLSVCAVLAATRVVPALPADRTSLLLRGREGPAAVEAMRVLGLPVLATMSDQRRVDEYVALGAGPLRSRGPLVRAARLTADRLAGGAR